MLKPETLEQQLDAILQIDASIIDRQVAEIVELQTALAVLDSDLNQYQQCHCNKTGRPLHTISIDCFQKLITTNDKRRSKVALEAYHTGQYCLDWIITDEIALDELFKRDPVGYAIYSIGLIYNAGWAIDRVSTWKQHQLRIGAWRNCNQLYQTDPATVFELNELVRRFLGLINPAKYGKNHILMIFNFDSLFESNFNISLFIDTLRENLATIVKHNYNEQLLVTTGTVANIKSRYNGISSFARQVKLKGMSGLDAVMYDLRDFMGQKTPEQIEIRVGLRAKPKTQNVFKQESGKSIELKIKPENKTTTTRTNAFSTMFAKQRGDK